MEILNKPIDTFSFKDVVDFCKLGYREGTQIDYKQDLPKDGLARHFAAFSNTLGGVIIIGVEEDKKTMPSRKLCKGEGVKERPQNR